ncbi:MAG TPA: hypothetical protein VH601_17785 [Bryobacteraceae bacterium]|jgi:hypothetical protein
MPASNPLGFAPADWLLAILTGIFILAAFIWSPTVQRVFTALATRTGLCMVLLFILPGALRLLLLPHHPAPTPEIYDEFSHLLVADTLLHGRLANPPHPLPQFFETFFELQRPTYSSIYPLGQGIVLAAGKLLSGEPWTGVLVAAGAFCGLCYWMLRGWVTPVWALLGGFLAVMEFGPLNQWMNSYWGGALPAAAGCLVFGALPRLVDGWRTRYAVLLGVGFGAHMLVRQFESLLLFAAVVLFLLPSFFQRESRPKLFQGVARTLLAVFPVVGLILLHNRAVTHNWTTLPEQLSRYQYGVPASLTIQPNPTPHAALTPQQELDYKAQALMHGAGTDTALRFLLRLQYRVRYYRFFFLPPLYIALIAFLFALRNRRLLWVTATVAIFALGTNLFPYLLLHYLAAVTCLFVLVSVIGLQQLSRLYIRGTPVGTEIVRVLVLLCVAEFTTWYALHLFENPAAYSVLRYETWDSIEGGRQQRRIEVQRQLAAMPGQLLVFVRYSAHHRYQDEWVWNGAEIDASRVVYARDLGPTENEKLIRYFPTRKLLLLEPDHDPPSIAPFQRVQEK